MKKLIFLLPVVAFSFYSCEKSENQEVFKQEQLLEIKQNAQKLSQIHDSILNLLLSEDSSMPSLVNSEFIPESNFNMDASFDLIEKVVGVRPYTVSGSHLGMMKVGVDSSTPQVNLDTEAFNLSDYGRTELTANYLEKVDALLRDSTMSVTQIQNRIDELQILIQTDPLATLLEIEDFMNGTEILKGSLGIWDSEGNKVKVYNGGPMYASNLKKWSFWKKMGFVATADAVGGVVGWFLGGFLVIQGQTVYVPAGPSGVMVSAALLSYMAAKMVGW